MREPAFKRRALVVAGVAGLLAGVAAFGTVSDSPEPPVARVTVIETLRPQVTEVASASAPSYVHEERFERGDTFARLLARLGVDSAVAVQLVKQHGKSKPFRSLRPGMTVQAETTDFGALLALRFISGRDTILGFEREGDGFRVLDEPARLARRVVLKSGEIRSSLFAAADEVDMPDAITMQIADIFSGDVDFQRDLRKGDRFAVVYEAFHHNGRLLKEGRVLAAEFVNNKKALRAVWFDDVEQGRGGYYAPDGKNLRKAFLRSPLEFSRVTSGFAMRFHPILQQWRAHNGVDYGAPTGTRVRATADGVVDFAGQQGGYGKVVILRHHGGITTAYAHLSSFAGDMRRGARMAQGDTIGFVGATGWATGPHLHYEFRVNNQHRNPLTVAMPAAEPVPAERMAAFTAAARRLTGQLELLADVRLAALE
ncbi:MAG TPA: peptidoglycan DD-metalloendopeptidase family protein [Burkholderiales bacterium]|nr:peptidoglycan DD-metalloendopeptidase family protein [Burkholderiales bacterium]